MEMEKMELKNEHHITTPIISPEETKLDSSAGVSDVIVACGKFKYTVKFVIMALAFLIITSTLAIALFQATVEMTCEQKAPWLHLITLILNLVGITIVAFFLAKKKKKFIISQ